MQRARLEMENELITSPLVFGIRFEAFVSGHFPA
jgi:hypothetical protein